MNFSDLKEQLPEKWSALSTAKKSAGIIMGLALIFAIILFVQSSGETQFTPLFSQLDPKDASAVVDKLKETGVNYKLSDQGSTILVPEKRVYELRLQLASDGILPSEGIGFELFDQNKLGMTEFERRLNYQRALQEELRRTIVSMQEVEQARVHLVIPEPSVFVEEKEEASASVVIKLRPLTKMKPEQVKGIVLLVANSVENLKPENVTVIDMSGRILSNELAFGQDRSLAASQLEQQEMKRRFEDNLEDRVEEMLGRIFGPGKAIAMITADLDFNQRQVTRIDYGRDGVVRSEQVVREETTSSTSSTGGVPGTESNMNTYPGLETGGNSTDQSKEDITRKYEIDQEQETVVYAPGTVKRLSTAVTVDGPLSEEQIAQIKELVTAAIGYYPDRGDRITVTSMAFDNSFTEKVQAAMEKQAVKEAKEKQLRQYISAGLAALALVLTFIIILVALRRRRSGELDATIEGVVPIQDISKEPIGDAGEVEKKDKKRQLRRMVEQKPEEAVELVKAWLEES